MSIRPRTRLAAAAVAAATALTLAVDAAPTLAAPVVAPAPAAAPVSVDAGVAPGPALETAPEVLAAALECGPGIDDATGTPVLLVHGTSSTPQESWAFGYARVLPALGHPVCAVRLPERAWGDMQTSTEYVVYAIREMASRSGRKVSVLGHSQGTVQPLWALRFWPDLAGKIDDYIGLAAPLQGTVAADLVCALPKQCPAAVWQYGAGSNFVAAMNRRPLPVGPSYTVVATLLDELVVPQPAASRRAGVTTVFVQGVCPGRVVEHVGLLGDAVAYAIVMDALGHAGPARKSRINRLTCFTGLLPGIDRPGYLAALPVFVANFAATALTARWYPAEPALRAYARQD